MGGRVGLLGGLEVRCDAQERALQAMATTAKLSCGGEFGFVGTTRYGHEFVHKGEGFGCGAHLEAHDGRWGV